MSPLSLTLVFLCISTVACQDYSPDLKILVGDMKPVIHQVSIRDNLEETLAIEGIRRPIAVDYDAFRHDLYWTDVNLQQIWTRNMYTSQTKILLGANSSSVMDGIAVDADRRMIFYSDTGYDVIGTLNTDGTGHHVIIDSGLEEPRAIVLFEERRMLYWTDWGRNPYIASAAYDGTHIDKLVTTGLLWPNGLALDKKNGVLYWCDGQTERIEAVNIDGRGRRVVLTELDTHYFDIFYINEALYFTDWNRRAIMSVPARGGSVGFVNNRRFERLNGIVVFSTVRESDCPLGRYGPGCQVCGHCKLDSVCDKTTGHCMAGCSDGYTGPQCTEVKGNPWVRTERPPTKPRDGSCHDGPPSHNRHTDNHSMHSKYKRHVIIIGAVAGVAILLLIVVVIILAVLIRRRRKQEVAQPNKDGGFATGEMKQPPMYSQDGVSATEEVKQPPVYFVSADLPPTYASVPKA